MRLFVALDLPPAVLGNLERLLATLRRSARIAWSPPANLHITTKFIGWWPDERLEDVKAALSGIPPRPEIEVRVHELGFFPNPRSPRVFWCGIQAPGLAELAADTDRATAAIGVETEKRPFSPHLTLARIKERIDMRPLEAAIASLSSLDFGGFSARSFYLYRSEPRPSGSVYTKLAEFPLSRVH
jgi:2'-5' RNA ligase